MFHIIKQVSIIPDVLVQQAGLNSIVISKLTDYTWSIDPTLLVKQPKVQNYYQDVASAFQQYGGEKPFFEKLASIDDFTSIYCDKDAYGELVIRWLRIIVPNITVSEAFKVYRLSLFNFYHNQLLMRDITDDILMIDEHQVINNFAMLTRDQFNEIFSNIDKPDNSEYQEFLKDNANYISNEYKIGFALNHDSRFDDYANEHINKLIAHSYIDSLLVWVSSETQKIFESNYKADSINDIKSKEFDLIKQILTVPTNTESIDQYEDLYNYCKQNCSDQFEYLDLVSLHDIAKADSLDQKIEYLINSARIDYTDLMTMSFDRINPMLLRHIINKNSKPNNIWKYGLK